MADVAKSGTPSLATTVPCPAHQIAGLLAGEAVAAGDACYIKSDGKVWRSTGAAANAAAQVDGFAAEAAASGEAVTLYHDVNFRYGAGLTPGARYYLSGATAGALADAASTGGTGAIAFAVDATRVRVMRSRY
jgi:hypothetical protein